MKSVQVYLGKPQTQKLSVCDVQPGQQITLKQMILKNSDEVEQKVTVTVNTIDIMTIKVKPGETEIRDTFIVLNAGDKLLLQQEKENAVSVMINGVLDVVTNSSY